jgi:hypothetical protein
MNFYSDISPRLRGVRGADIAPPLEDSGDIKVSIKSPIADIKLSML